MNQEKRIERAIDQIMIQAPFFGTLLLGLKLKPSSDIPTLATNGIDLLYNPAYVAKLTDAQLRGVLVHEVMHPAAGHFARQGGREIDLFNKAADYEINLDVIAAGFELPDGALVDSKYRAMNAEAIYAALYRAREKQQQGAPQGKPSPGGQQSGQQAQAGPQGAQGAAMPGGNDPGLCGSFFAPDNAAELAEDWNARVMSAAAITGRHAGSLPGSIRRLVESIRRPSINWREAMEQFVTDSSSKRHSWNKPARRFIAHGIYLPGLVSDGRGRVIAIVDMSGSIDKTAASAFNGHLQHAMDNGAADSVTVVYTDTKVRRVVEYEAGDSIVIDTTAGGGTDFRDVMSWAAVNSGDAACILFFTDMQCDAWGDDPGIPVLWANWSRPPHNPPAFGEIIQIDGHA